MAEAALREVVEFDLAYELGASDLYLVGYSAVFLIVMLLLPRGILPSLSHQTRRFRAGRIPPAAPKAERHAEKAAVS